MFRSMVFGVQTQVMVQLSRWQTHKMLSTFTDSIKLSEDNQVGVLTLNRPKVFNALNMETIDHMHSVLSEWKNTKSLVIVKSDLKSVFCAGGDLREQFESPQPQREKFMKGQYRLNYLISTIRSPYVSFINGITMGGGAGISVHGMYRVATENTVFAMPEGKIGLFPDVGFSYVLPRLPGHIGMYLGMTGVTLKGRDVFSAGIATHYCDYAKLTELETALALCSSPTEIKKTLSKFCPVDPTAKSSMEPHLSSINECFAGKTVEAIVSNLENLNSDWSRKVLKLMSTTAPMSLKITHRLLQNGANLDLAECLKIESRLMCRLLSGTEADEGVRALIIEKDNKPKWKYPTLKDVSDDEVLSLFKPYKDASRELDLSAIVSSQ